MALTLVDPKTDIGQLVLGPAVTIPSDSTIRQAAQAMRRSNVSSALVGGPDSIVTERDLAAAVADGFDPSGPVTSIASDHPIVVDAHTPVVEAAGIMLNHGVRHLIVLDAEEPGVVSLRTVMAALLQAVEPRAWLRDLRLTAASSSELWLG